MIDLNRNQFGHLTKLTSKLKEAFTDHLDQHIKIPSSLLSFVFPQAFFQSEVYLVFPYFFKKVFGGSEAFAEKLCISGFLYFKYLLSIDELLDDDMPDKNKSAGSLTLLKSHIYHEESLKILANQFGRNEKFWKLWNQRNNEFLKSVLLDKEYNVNMTFETYTTLAITKCSFSKVAVDAYFSKYNSESTQDIYTDLIKSIDYFSIARCIQDDLEDFSKDLLFKKNNLGHILLHEWLSEQGKRLEDQPHDVLEKMLFTSEIAEKMLALSKEYYQKAINQVMPYQNKVSDYSKMLEILRNNINHYKVNIQAYRVDKYISSLNAPAVQQKTSLSNAIELSRAYISNMQNADGSWYEISNMQGLSNVWSTGFIASFLPADNECVAKANNFLVGHKQGKLWGYNTDWTFDFDSTTCALLSLSHVEERIDQDMKEWMKGQTPSGGFSTYSIHENNLFSNLGLKKKEVKGWLHDHTCVSALAYYFMSSLATKNNYEQELNSLKNYILSKRTKDGVWKPYWWTSYIYPTSFIVQGMLQDGDSYDDYIEQSMNFLVKKQNNDGSFSCEILNHKSSFYTALVLDTLCASKKLFMKYRDEATRMKDWLLEQQYSNGYFSGSDFLVIPNPDVINWKVAAHTFKVKKTGGGNTITGEIANLFSTSVASRALQRFKDLN